MYRESVNTSHDVSSSNNGIQSRRIKRTEYLENYWLDFKSHSPPGQSNSPTFSFKSGIFQHSGRFFEMNVQKGEITARLRADP